MPLDLTSITFLASLLGVCGPVAAPTDPIDRSGPVADVMPAAASHPASDSVRRVRPWHADTIVPSDTTPRRRVAVAYSEAYGTRATIHRRLSYAMLPLFALSYVTGDRLFDQGPGASATVRNLHRASATSVAALFTVNTVTGGINLWEGRHDPVDRKRRLLHSALFVAAGAGFTYAGAVLANQAETSLGKRRDHRNLNLVSMGLSASSVLVMMVGRD